MIADDFNIRMSSWWKQEATTLKDTQTEVHLLLPMGFEDTMKLYFC